MEVNYKGSGTVFSLSKKVMRREEKRKEKRKTNSD